MYKINKEYIGQSVTVFTPDNRVIKLDSATQEEFKIAYAIKGNEKFITIENKKEIQKDEPKIEVKEIEEEITKDVVRRGRPKL